MPKININLSILVFFLSVFVFFSSGHFGGDGIENYLTARSVVIEQDLSIYDDSFGVKEMRYDSTKKNRVTGRGGKIYSSYAMGMPILLLPLFFLGHIVSLIVKGVPADYITQFFVSLTNPIIYACMALFIFMILQKLKYSKQIAFITALVSSFCTMNLIYARSGFSDPAVALFFLISGYFLLRYFQKGPLFSVLLSGAAFSYAVFIKKHFIIYILCYLLIFYIAYKRDKNILKAAKAVFAFLVPVGICILLILIFNYLRFGGALNTEFGTPSDMLSKGTTGARYIKASYYYLLSSGKGYLFFNIPLILALFGIRGFLKKQSLFGIFALSLIMLNLAFCVWIFQRGSLFSWGPRYLLLTVPFMSIFMAEFIAQAKEPFKRFTIILLSSLGFLVQFPCLFINNSKWLFFIKEQLQQKEYMINFIPDLSPIKGCWILFISMIKNLISGESMAYAYNPDPLLVKRIAASLSGYDIMDTWWFHTMKLYPVLMPYTIFSIVLLFLLVSLSLLSIRRELK